MCLKNFAAIRTWDTFSWDALRTWTHLISYGIRLRRAGTPHPVSCILRVLIACLLAWINEDSAESGCCSATTFCTTLLCTWFFMSLFSSLDFSELAFPLGLGLKISTWDKLHIINNILEHPLNHLMQDDVYTTDVYTLHLCVDNV